MEKIKVSFEPTEAWNREEFRQLIYNIKNGMYNDTRFEYELWIITTNDSLPYVNALAQQLDIPNARVQMCLNDTTKVGIIAANADIHLDIDQVIITALEPTNVRGILVDRKIAYPAIGLKYIQDLDKWTAIILRERNNNEKTTPC